MNRVVNGNSAAPGSTLRLFTANPGFGTSVEPNLTGAYFLKTEPAETVKTVDGQMAKEVALPLALTLARHSTPDYNAELLRMADEIVNVSAVPL